MVVCLRRVPRSSDREKSPSNGASGPDRLRQRVGHRDVLRLRHSGRRHRERHRFGCRRARAEHPVSLVVAGAVRRTHPHPVGRAVVQVRYRMRARRAAARDSHPEDGGVRPPGRHLVAHRALGRRGVMHVVAGGGGPFAPGEVEPRVARADAQGDRRPVGDGHLYRTWAPRNVPTRQVAAQPHRKRLVFGVAVGGCRDCAGAGGAAGQNADGGQRSVIAGLRSARRQSHRNAHGGTLNRAQHGHCHR